MCEEHSPRSELQPLRKLDGRRHRRMPFEMLKRVVGNRRKGIARDHPFNHGRAFAL